VSGIDGAGAWLGRVPDAYPRVRIAFEVGPRPHRGDGTPRVTEDRVVFELGAERSLVVDRVSESEASATCWDARPGPPSAAEAVHPLLTAAAAVVGSWRGYDAFHAAAVVGAGGVWGLLGDKESGKSTLAAALAASGHAVVCDDMLALRGTTAFTGPRCVDLRPDAALHLNLGQDLGIGGSRPRWRVTLPPLVAEQPMAGWVLLSWGERLELARIAPRDVLTRLGGRQTWPHQPIDASALLDLATLPAWELRRPRGWSSLAATVAELQAVVAPRPTDVRPTAGG
jgi:hypothetical protein